ncbi:MAG: acetoacetate--CoA ligase [Spirochaetes bacterium]|nr:acetoacetate--CoA ligase [Spirochaetota bacterium]
MNQILWQPKPHNPMQAFREYVAERTGRQLANYAELHKYSVEHIGDFWQILAEYAKIPFLKPATAAMEIHSPWRESRFFVGAEVNWAHIALAARRHSKALALESYDENGLRAACTYAELYKRVAAMQQLLHSHGIQPRDRLAAFMPNTEETLVALLGAVASGATFSSTSPDFGAGAAADRLSQFSPRYLVAATHYFFKGKKISVVDKIIEIVRKAPAVETLFIFRAGEAELALLQSSLPSVKIVSVSAETESGHEIHFAPYSFQDPLYVMYSSGTTGLPKCIVQGHGVVVNHIKEHTLHCGSNETDKIFYYTTCGWMMYNWLVSGLCFGAALVLFDGNPFAHGPAQLWKTIADAGATVFGTSAKYLTTLMQHNYDARALTATSKIRLICSTGSVLPPEGFTYVYEHIHPTAQLASISGGTDLNGCWALGNPDVPVRVGELQSCGLGMAVEIFNDAGASVTQEMGELVCTAPFPSMPLYFLGDADGSRYRASYFERFAGRDIWAHGDFAELTAEGGMVFGGRSDATLNPGGVRIGTAEIYRVLELIPFIEDSLIIGRPIDENGLPFAIHGSADLGASVPHDEEVILFIKLHEGTLSHEQISEVKQTIRDKVSPRHVPAKVFQVQGVPYTINGKKVELAVKYIALGRPITNRETIANKEVLAEYESILKQGE